MTVIATTVFLHTTATRSDTIVTTITAGTASTVAVTIAIVTSIKRLTIFFTAALSSLPMFDFKISFIILGVYNFYIVLYKTNTVSEIDIPSFDGHQRSEYSPRKYLEIAGV